LLLEISEESVDIIKKNAVQSKFCKHFSIITWWRPIRNYVTF